MVRIYSWLPLDYYSATSGAAYATNATRPAKIFRIHSLHEFLWTPHLQKAKLQFRSADSDKITVRGDIALNKRPDEKKNSVGLTSCILRGTHDDRHEQREEK